MLQWLQKIPNVAKLLAVVLLFVAVASYAVFEAAMPQARTDGTVIQTRKISDLEGNFLATLDNLDSFGIGVEEIGDLDGDGIKDFAAGAWKDDDGGADLGAMYILFMTRGGSVKDFQKISSTEGGFGGVLTTTGDFGVSIANMGDLDLDGVQDLAVGERASDDGGNNRGSVWILFMNTDGTVKAEQEISDTAGGFTATLDNLDLFGGCVENMGDLDGDEVQDLGVCVSQDDDGGTDRGAFYILYLNTDGTVKSYVKHSDTTGGFAGTLEDNDKWGSYLVKLHDLDGDGVDDWATTAPLDDDGGSNRGAVYILFMNADETVKDYQKISATEGNFSGFLDNEDRFGATIDSWGDIDGDRVDDLVVGAWNDDDGASNAGAVYILFLNADGTVKSTQKISETTGGFTGDLDADDIFGFQVAAINNFTQGGSRHLLVGAAWDDDGGTDRGSVYVLTLNHLSNSDGATLKPTGDFVVNGGAVCTESRDVYVTLVAEHARDVVIGNDPYFVDQEWQPFLEPSPMVLEWQLPDADGIHTVYVLYRSRTQDLSNLLSRTITLDRQNGCP